MSFPRYIAYKDSGVAWLGEVPGHWEVLQSKRLFRKRKELNSGMVCENRLALTMGGVVPRALDDLDGLQASEFETYQIFQKDDLAFKLIDLQNIKTSRVGIVPEMGIMSPAYIRLEANQTRLWPKFGYWYFTDLYNRTVFNQLGGGVRQTLGPEELLVLPCTVPSLTEQQIIAAFLDRETGKIDALVAEQQKLIALLKEKRQAAISHAVTKGLNPAAKMKDSGIEWLGEVPAHWEVMPLKRDLLFLTSGSRGWADHYADEGALFIRIGNLPRDNVHLDLSDIQRVDVPGGTEGERTKVQTGDVLFSITAYLGSVAVVPEDLEAAYVSQHVALARLSGQSLLPSWVAYVTLSSVGKIYLETQGYGGTKVQLSLDDVRNMPMLVPSLDEQRTIVSFLEAKTAKLDALNAGAQRAIELLKERRSALISAAVTGKIDVRSLTPTPHPKTVEGKALEAA